MPDQTAQVVQAALQAPINNLVVLLALFALLIMALGGVLVWKFAPALINLYKQQAETNATLTKIVGQNSKQAEVATQSVEKNTAEMIKQTTAIEAQTAIIEGQGRNLNAYQTLVSDNLSAHTEQIAANTASIAATNESVAALKESIDNLSKQIEEMLSNRADCIDFKDELEKFERRLLETIKKRETGTVATTTNVLTDTVDAPPTAAADGAGEANAA